MSLTPADERELDRMRPVEEVRATVLHYAAPLPAEPVALALASGRTLAADLVAAADQPPFPAAIMDGFAVQADDGSPWRELIGEQMAGRTSAPEVTPGTAVRITTGAPMPPGADAVVQVEATDLSDDNHVIIHQDEIAVGLNVRPVGFDVRAGDVLLSAGTPLGPPEVGMLAGEGQLPVMVVKRPRVSVLSTGDELVEPGQPLGPGQIRDANRFSLVAVVEAAGAEVVWSGKAPDERESLRQLLVERLEDSDVVVTSGGVSMGELDLVKALLPEIARVHSRRVFMKPGKPLNVATFGPDDRTLFFGLPGNPVSALACFELFVRPALLTMLGRSAIDRPRVPVVLAAGATPGDRPEYQRAIMRVGEDGRLVGEATGVQASSRLASWVGANALLVIPPGEAPLPAGSVVQGMLLAAPLGAT
jgi:molybdenum cofactor synthesis domain-containing protein